MNFKTKKLKPDIIIELIILLFAIYAFIFCEGKTGYKEFLSCNKLNQTCISEEYDTNNKLIKRKEFKLIGTQKDDYVGDFSLLYCDNEKKFCPALNVYEIQFKPPFIHNKYGDCACVKSVSVGQRFYKSATDFLKNNDNNINIGIVKQPNLIAVILVMFWIISLIYRILKDFNRK